MKIIKNKLALALVGVGLLCTIGCSSSEDIVTEENGITITQSQPPKAEEQKADESTETQPSQEAESVAVYLKPGVDRVWQNGPSPDALKRGRYKKSGEARVSGTTDSNGNNTPVLLEIPATDRGPSPARHGLDP